MHLRDSGAITWIATNVGAMDLRQRMPCDPTFPAPPVSIAAIAASRNRDRRPLGQQLARNQ